MNKDELILIKILFILYFILYGDWDWGLGIGDWGLGIGDWAQSPIPNPQSPFRITIKIIFLIIITYKINYFKLLNKNNYI